MSRFAPPRASTPPTQSTISHSFSSAPAVPSTTVSAPGRSDRSRSSAVSAPELANLTPDQIDFIDTVISRASPSATTFLTVFKAYNDVLHDRGLDPQHEVVYYGKLLKVGTLKGANWGDKWNAVKEKCGYVSSATRAPPQKPAPSGVARVKAYPPEPTARPLPSAAGNTRGKYQTGATTTQTSAGRLLSRLRNLRHHHDSDHTEPSVLDATDATRTEATDETEHNVPCYPRQPPRPTPITRNPATSSAITTTFDITAPSSYPLHPHPRPPARWPSPESELSDDTAPSVSTKPPSYKTTARDANGKASLAALRAIPTQTHVRAPSTFAPTVTSSPLKALRSVPHERRGSVVNEDEAWNKVKMMQDEKEADRFREEKLVERCWDVWKQGFDWIIVSSYTPLILP